MSGGLAWQRPPARAHGNTGAPVEFPADVEKHHFVEAGSSQGSPRPEATRVEAGRHGNCAEIRKVNEIRVDPGDVPAR